MVVVVSCYKYGRCQKEQLTLLNPAYRNGEVGYGGTRINVPSMLVHAIQLDVDKQGSSEGPVNAIPVAPLPPKVEVAPEMIEDYGPWLVIHCHQHRG